MKAKISAKVVVLLFIIAIIIFSYYVINARSKLVDVIAKGHRFRVEVADTQEERMLGLMRRENLREDGGMLFVFPEEGLYPFWMKDTLIPLDMIWIDSNKTVVYIEKDAQPCKVVQCPSIDPGVEALYVLELNAGISDKIGLEQGDKINF